MLNGLTQRQAAEKVGVSRWTLRQWEKQYPGLKTPDGGYDFNLLMLLASPKNPGLIRNLQAECFTRLARIEDPGPLLLIESLLSYFERNPSSAMQQVRQAAQETPGAVQRPKTEGTEPLITTPQAEFVHVG